MTDRPERLRVGDRVTIDPRGKKKTWCADFWFDGKHHRRSLETCSRKVAVRRAVRLDADLLSGKYQAQRPATAATVRQAVEDYLAYLRTEGRARKTLTRYQGELYALRDFLERH